MKKIQKEQLELLYGGLKLSTVAGGTCGAAVSGFFFGGFPGVITGLIFGPSCIGLSLATALDN